MGNKSIAVSSSTPEIPLASNFKFKTKYSKVFNEITNADDLTNDSFNSSGQSLSKINNCKMEIFFKENRAKRADDTKLNRELYSNQFTMGRIQNTRSVERKFEENQRKDFDETLKKKDKMENLKKGIYKTLGKAFHSIPAKGKINLINDSVKTPKIEYLSTLSTLSPEVTLSNSRISDMKGVLKKELNSISPRKGNVSTSKTKNQVSIPSVCLLNRTKPQKVMKKKPTPLETKH